MGNRLIFLYYLPSLIPLVNFRIGEILKGIRKEKKADRNDEKLLNLPEFFDSESQ